VFDGKTIERTEGGMGGGAVAKEGGRKRKRAVGREGRARQTARGGRAEYATRKQAIF